MLCNAEDTDRCFPEIWYQSIWSNQYQLWTGLGCLLFLFLSSVWNVRNCHQNVKVGKQLLLKRVKKILSSEKHLKAIYLFALLPDRVCQTFVTASILPRYFPFFLPNSYCKCIFLVQCSPNSDKLLYKNILKRLIP